MVGLGWREFSLNPSIIGFMNKMVALNTKETINAMRELRGRELAINERLKELRFEGRVWRKITMERLREMDKLKEELENIKKKKEFICGETKVKK